jgi:beta-glucosidase-like glycosyl hydrolase
MEDSVVVRDDTEMAVGKKYSMGLAGDAARTDAGVNTVLPTQHPQEAAANVLRGVSMRA